MKRFKRHSFAAAVLAISLTACTTTPSEKLQTAAQARKANTAVPVDNLINQFEVVATVNSKNVAVDLERQALEWGYTLKKQEKLAGLNLYLLTFDCPPGVDPKDASLELERLQPKASVGEQHKYLLNSSDLSLNAINTPRTFANDMLQWPKAACESQMKIGMIDGDISQNFLNQSDAKIHIASFIDSSPSEAAIMHGTSIGAILSNPDRIRDVELYAAAVVSQDKNGNDYSSPTAILKALDWMLINDVNVVNISLSGPPNRVMESAFEAATDNGLIVVAAVGNQGPNSSPQFPAAYNTVLAATAVDVAGDIYDKAVIGDHVDFSAPGVDVYIDTIDERKYISGTSIAAPFITVAIASSEGLMGDNNRNNIIRHFSASSTDLGPKGKDKTFGLGLINAKNICSTG